jgi:hypothetical protein
MKSDKILSLKITLNDSSPSIWRRILVPADYSFFDLHCAIQNAMGWFDSHLHGFAIGQKGTARTINIKLPDPENDDLWEDKYEDERKEKISNYFGKSIKQCIYTYDYGDSWDHTVLFEKEIDVDPKQKYPQCVAGKNSCPPEDCGGLGGYNHLIEVLKNPKDEEYEDMLEWLAIDDPKELDPSYFDLSEVEFEDPKKRLKEVEKGFGIKPIS